MVKVIEWNLVPSSPAGLASFNRVHSMVHDALAAGAIRAPGAAVTEARRHACAVLVANLMDARKAGLIVPWKDVDKPSRYNRVARRGFEKVVEALEGLKLVRVIRQGRETGGNKANEIRPTGALLTMLAGCTVKDCSMDPMAEIVVLKDRLGEDGGPLTRSTYVDYDDTEYTETVREQVRTINAHLGEPGRVVHPRHGGSHALRRYYCRGSFDHGGRLFGHWAQSLKKTERHGLLIDDAPVVAVDYPAMFARLLFAREGLQAPAGDLYAFAGWHRDGVKKVFNAILCRERPSSRFPKGVRGQGWFPAGIRFPEVEAALHDRFPGLRRAANTGVGLRLMRTESDVLIEACLWLIERGIGFVPIHDALLVPVFEAGRAQYAMWRAFKVITGVELASGAEPVITPCSAVAGALLENQQLMGRSTAPVWPVESPLPALVDIL